MKSGTALASSGWIKGGMQIARNKISASINPLRQQRGLKVVSSSHLVLSHLNHFNSSSFGLCDPISWYHKNVLLKPLFVSLSFPSLLGPFAVFSWALQQRSGCLGLSGGHGITSTLPPLLFLPILSPVFLKDYSSSLPWYFLPTSHIYLAHLTTQNTPSAVITWWLWSIYKSIQTTWNIL